MSKKGEDKSKQAPIFCALCVHHVARPPLLDLNGKLQSCGFCRVLREPVGGDSTIAEDCPDFKEIS